MAMENTFPDLKTDWRFEAKGKVPQGEGIVI
jgi:hypothetical protein